MTFNEDCHKLLKKVPKGRVTIYKEIAEALGTKAYRVVETAINSNSYFPLISCLRIVNSTSEIGGFALTIKKKIAILKTEGVQVKKGKMKDFEKKLYKF